MNTPKISIIIPIYNIEKYLRRCLASILGQTLREIEIICVNDGSTDNSLSILLDYANQDERIVVIDQKNGGTANARNAGLKKATAPFIGFVDSDDFLVPDMCEIMYNAMINNNVDFVECGAEPIFTYETKSEVEYRYQYSTGGLSGKIEDPNVFIVTTGTIWRTLYKKKIINQFNLNFAEDFKCFEDSLFIWSYKSLVNNGFFIQEKLYIHYHFNNSVMGNVINKQDQQRISETLITTQLYFLFLKENNQFERLKNIFWSYFTGQINTFYYFATPSLMESFGITFIKDLLKNKEILDLIDEKNISYRKFLTLKDSELMDNSFLTEVTEDTETTDNTEAKVILPLKRKITFRKIIKWCLPYGVVRIIQIVKEKL